MTLLRNLSFLLLTMSLTNAFGATKPGPFTKRQMAEEKLNATWTGLLVQALNSGRSPYEMSKYFPRAEKEYIEKLKSLPWNPSTKIVALKESSGSLLFKESGKVHRLRVLSTFPVVSIAIDSDVVELPMGKGEFKESFNKLIKSSMGGKFAHIPEARFSLFPEANAQLVPFVAGLIVGGVASSSRGYYSDNVTNTYVVDPYSEEKTYQLKRIAEQQEIIANINQQLAKVEIPNRMFDLAEKTKNPAASEELRGQAETRTDKLAAEPYSDLLKDIRSQMQAKPALQFLGCQRRQVGSTYSIVKDDRGEPAISAVRKALDDGIDSREVQIGDTVLKVMIGKDDPAREFGPYNEKARRASLCRGSQCSTVQSQSLDLALQQEVRRKVWKTTDVAKYRDIVKQIKQKYDDKYKQECRERYKQYPFVTKQYCDWVTPEDAEEVLGEWSKEWTHSFRMSSDCKSNIARAFDDAGNVEGAKALIKKARDTIADVKQCAEESKNAQRHIYLADTMGEFADALERFQSTLSGNDPIANSEAAREMTRSLRRLNNIAEKRDWTDEDFKLAKTPDLNANMAEMDSQTIRLAETLTAGTEHSLCCSSAFCRDRLAQMETEEKALKSLDSDEGKAHSAR